MTLSWFFVSDTYRDNNIIARSINLVNSIFFAHAYSDSSFFCVDDDLFIAFEVGADAHAALELEG